MIAQKGHNEEKHLLILSRDRRSAERFGPTERQSLEVGIQWSNTYTYEW
jgi:hypothetical protein